MVHAAQKSLALDRLRRKVTTTNKDKEATENEKKYCVSQVFHVTYCSHDNILQAVDAGLH